MKVARRALLALLVAQLLLARFVNGQTPHLATVLRNATGPVDRAHAAVGIAIYDEDRRRMIYEQDAFRLFSVASTIKLVTEGTSLALLGEDYRFTTRVYRTGTIGADGVLDGDLILRASGDPNLSGRVKPDGTLAFENVDHSYDGAIETKAVPGDPLLVLRQLAQQVAAAGVRRITGRVIVDNTLFPESVETATGVTVSPIAVNDNIVDVTVAPGSQPGSPASLTISPPTPYVSFVNRISTAARGETRAVAFAGDVAGADGNRTVTMTGTMPLGTPPILYAYDVPTPKRFAEIALTVALQDLGVGIPLPGPDGPFDSDAAQKIYAAGNVVAEHRSPPLREDVKVTLKVSDNMHAAVMPYIWGIVAGHGGASDALQRGFDAERALLSHEGLDLNSVYQSDGLGVDASFTPQFAVQYLTFLRRQPYASVIDDALPVLGRDGTLADVERFAPSAGKVRAKTGTWTRPDLLHAGQFVMARGLAGYMTTADGRHLTFCFLLNNFPVSAGHDPAAVAGALLGHLATDTYLYAP
ncbi:MAG: D-alanyl-D-alanine carboxypeptidase/D-alanyl-D-alanine-endopeptidase [Candidatus Eremiobacteraeota bacterium]|nr:D-alanyl-D-alanine carboxypeptidase/D-alanyl-D-alanine-endopeptidase [Candidatus Eremiobacteraeota bacterium]